MTAGDWRLRAACGDKDKDAAFGDLRKMYAFIQDNCGKCPVVGECLSSAMAAERVRGTVRFGVAGGLLPGQRRRLEITGSTSSCADCGAPFLPTSATQERCRPCRFVRGRARAREPWPVTKPHGTRAGYEVHRRRDEEACGACKRAKAESSVQWRAQRWGAA